MLQQTFMSVWYWGLLALLWAMICNWTFGVPNELLIRAGKSGEDAELFDRFARRNIAMISRAIDRQGISKIQPMVGIIQRLYIQL